MKLRTHTRTLVHTRTHIHAYAHAHTRKNAKKSEQTKRKNTPPHEKKTISELTHRTQNIYITQSIRVSEKTLSLYMDWIIELRNRIHTGFAIGWSYYHKDDKYDYSEFSIHLGLLEINLLYK